MGSVVEELQANCLDPGIGTVVLLRKAKVIAAKLELAELEGWVDFELDGYPPNGEVPKYRKTSGQLVWLNPYRGWMPVNFGAKAADIAKRLSSTTSTQPIGVIEELLRPGNGTGDFQMPYGAEVAAKICAGMDVDPTQVALRIDRSVLNGVLDGVRNQILQWSLKLERLGILGQGISFSDSERRKAHEPSVIYQIDKIENFSGNMGPVSGEATVNAQQTIGIAVAEVAALLTQVSQYVDALGLAPNAASELRGYLESLRSEIAAKEPKPTVMRELLKSVRNVVEGAAGSIIASGILAHIDKIQF